jgi:magnesium-transporting ATPase (P-type)
VHCVAVPTERACVCARAQQRMRSATTSSELAVGKPGDAEHAEHAHTTATLAAASKVRKTVHQRVHEAVMALALCHNVTPVFENDDKPNEVSYQASRCVVFVTALVTTARHARSPDEIALVQFTESVDLALTDRDFTSITLRNPLDEEETFDVLVVYSIVCACACVDDRV